VNLGQVENMPQGWKFECALTYRYFNPLSTGEARGEQRSGQGPKPQI
jgi:hypothetical protein